MDFVGRAAFAYHARRGIWMLGFSSAGVLVLARPRCGEITRRERLVRFHVLGLFAALPLACLERRGADALGLCAVLVRAVRLSE